MNQQHKKINLVIVLFLLNGIGFSQNPIDAFIFGIPEISLEGTATEGLKTPRDLDFHTNASRLRELWVLNEGDQPYSNNTQYNEIVCVPNNTNLTFGIFDSQNDGICCGFGIGNYEVIACGSTVASGGDFNSQELTNFSVTTCNTSDCDAGYSTIQINILTDNYGGETSWKVYNTSTQEVYGSRDEPGGSTVIYHDTGLETQSSEFRKDSYSGHFMHTASAIAFSDNNTFANAIDVQDANNNSNGFFTGASLWPSDLSIYAVVNQSGGLLGSHLDMIHQSPYSEGIAAESGNVYWLFDGYHNAICKYDFATPHEYGGDDHSDGEVWRHSSVNVSRVPGLSSHMEFDEGTPWLYIADSGNERILKMNTNTGTNSGSLQPYGENLAGYWNVTGTTVETVVSTDLGVPTGLEISNDRLLITDYTSGDIIIYDLEQDPVVELGRIETGKANNIMGIKVGPDDNIWFVCPTSNELYKISTLMVGDVNSDGQISIFDVIFCVKYILGLTTLSDEEIQKSDVNFDGEIDIFDVLIISDMAAN